MSRPRPGGSTATRRAPAPDGPLRLDLLVNPYGPSAHVQDALAACDDLHLPSPERELRLHLRLARTLGVPPDWLVLANGIDELLGMILLWRRDRGPLVLFPPSDPEDERRAARYGLEVVRVPRSGRFTLDLEPGAARCLPRGATALVASPNDPTGTLLGSQAAVRLARACELVVVDERHAEYSGRSLMPLAREFENMVVVGTFETWAGLTAFPCAYAVAPPRLAADLRPRRRPGGVATGAILAADATLDDLVYVRATVQRVREEKSSLFRMLRKLNMLRPCPSWANFLPARIERDDADFFARELARRGIQVHRPSHPDLDAYIRISATRPDHTLALKRALIEIAAPL